MIEQKQIRDNAGMMRMVGDWSMVVSSRPGPSEVAVSNLRAGWSFRGCREGLTIDGITIVDGDLIIVAKDSPDLTVATDWVVLPAK